MSLENRKVLITGSDRGIRLGLVKAFLSRGSVVIATARDPSSADELTDFKSQFKENLFIFQLDTISKEMHEVVKKSLQEQDIRELDIVIVNAEISTPEHRHDSAITSTIEYLVEVYRTNSVGTLLTFQTVETR
jgi:NAD(P)-dependent dehydrogenase (short-subunit alcohol dehydrogenase family)